jgi:hypothetical protein
MKYVNDELRVEFSVGDFLSRLTDRFSLLLVKKTQLHVHIGSGLLDDSEGSDERPREN